MKILTHKSESRSVEHNYLRALPAKHAVTNSIYVVIDCKYSVTNRICAVHDGEESDFAGPVSIEYNIM